MGATARFFEPNPAMAATEKRRDLRRTVNYPAWIDFGDGSPARECLFCDVSDKGAQLTVAEPDRLPDQFTLALSAAGAASRRCRVIWIRGKQVGVQFLKHSGKAARKRPLRLDYPLPAGVKPVESDGTEHA